MARDNSILYLGALALLIGAGKGLTNNTKKRYPGKVLNQGAQHCDWEIFGECLAWDYDYKVRIEGKLPNLWKPLTKELFEADPNFQNSVWLFPGNPDNYGLRIIDTPNWKALPGGTPLMSRADPYIRGNYSQNWDPGNLATNYEVALQQAGNNFAAALESAWKVYAYQPGSVRLVGPEFTKNQLSWIQTGSSGVSPDFRLGIHYLNPYQPFDPEEWNFQEEYTDSYYHNVKRDQEWDKAVAITKLAIQMYIKYQLTGTV